MKIALVGYGKMGKAIESIALERGHSIVLKTTSSTPFNKIDLQKADVVIEFTRPESAKENLLKCFEANVPVVTGTTGWYDSFDELSQNCNNSNSALFHATNFSLGVNLTFFLNEQLAKLMNQHQEYKVEIEEIHHTQKLDAPSGTAITLAEGILNNLDSKSSWVNDESSAKDELFIRSIREPKVPGTHVVSYSSEIDEISIKHVAHNRKGFALGAVLAAEWVIGKQGVFTMRDLLNF